MIKELWTLILILFATTTIVISETGDLNPEQLRNLEEALHQSSIYMEEEARDEDVAICIGATRSGKSTLMNYLIGNPLIGERRSRGKPITISKADNSSGPDIGSGSTSRTTIPTRWISRNFPAMSIWDAPGFDDNRGPLQDITNAFYLYQLLQKVRSLKIILVIDIYDLLNDNIRPFESVLNALENLLKHRMRDCFRSISVVFSKVPNTLNDVPVDMEFINNLLKDQILSNSDMSMSQVSKEFVQFLITNNQQIGLFKRAELGPVTSTIGVNLFKAIENSRSTKRNVLTQISPSISDASILVLYKAREALSSTSAFDSLHNTVRYVLDAKVSQMQEFEGTTASRSNLKAIYNDLMNIRGKISETFNSSLNFHQKVNILQTIDPAIASQIQRQNLFEKAKRMEFVDKLLELKESNQFDINLHGVLSSSSNKVSESIIVLQLKLGEISQGESRERLEQERRKFEEEQRKLYEELQMVQKQNSKRKHFILRIIEKVVDVILPHVINTYG